MVEHVSKYMSWAEQAIAASDEETEQPVRMELLQRATVYALLAIARGTGERNIAQVG
jgi:hypothetical protein